MYWKGDPDCHVAALFNMYFVCLNMEITSNTQHFPWWSKESPIVFLFVIQLQVITAVFLFKEKFFVL